MSQTRSLDIDREIEAEKQRELEMLENIERLSWFPMTRGPGYSAKHPHASDVDAFKTLVMAFKPSHYRDMLEERNVNGLCAYALCPNPRRNLGPGGQWKIQRDGQILPRKNFEMWCSEDCASRALYVQVQLDRTAWQRLGRSTLNVELVGEFDGQLLEDGTVVRLADKLRPLQESKFDQNAATLALERGDTQPKRSGDARLEIAIKEKETHSTGSESSTITTPCDHLMVEGHKTKLPFRTHTQT